MIDMLAFRGAYFNKFVSVVTVHASDDNHDVGLLCKLNGGSLTVLGGLAYGVFENDL
jgi:hypothetical protein